MNELKGAPMRGAPCRGGGDKLNKKATQALGLKTDGGGAFTSSAWGYQADTHQIGRAHV